MYKIRKITFTNHPILKNLSLDFCDTHGKVVDTVIIAGENGCGKSTLLECLYSIASGTTLFYATVEIEDNSIIHTLRYFSRIVSSTNYAWVEDNEGIDTLPSHPDFKNKYPFAGIFSDVGINFHAEEISNVTSLTLDSENGSRRSSNALPTQIKQLLIDIQALDDADVACSVRNNPAIPIKDLCVEERMPRFTKAFNKMFDGLTYSRIQNVNNRKSIVFRKCGSDITIDNLSSGEKQIVYRGCFLLKDGNAMNGAFVFIDEPEISLHPAWQMKILDYYKGMFTDLNGSQTSQIFVVTHSPFIIHNERRKNDKVLVLVRDEQGNITVNDRPEYYKCTSIEAVKDAFSIADFSAGVPTVYLEGRTDEKYFNKALEVFNLKVPFKFRWVGYLKENGQEENTGKDALSKAVSFLVGRNLPYINVCLFDCDTSRAETGKNNVYTRVLPTYNNSRHMKKGIENALVLDPIDIAPFYVSRTKIGDYGDDSLITEFRKMEFCENICSMDKKVLLVVFANLKIMIDSIAKLFL